MTEYRFILWFVWLNVFFHSLGAQKLLQLEILREVEAIKFGEGSTITFKTKEYPKEWQTKKIETIIPVEDILVFDDGMVSIKDITQLRLSNGTAKAFGQLFSGFGAGWLLFGGVAQIAGDYEFTWGTFAIGAVAVGLGWILNKFVSKKTYKMGKNANLRIIDISFSLTPVPTVQTNGGYP
ncbi:MAG: hypothetical protein KA270_02570 [Saprospiraceae bacterium]|nr:hypothetical protein [Saprospiraceae bacterium]